MKSSLKTFEWDSLKQRLTKDEGSPYLIEWRPMRNLRRNHENPVPSLNLIFPSNGGLREFGREERFRILIFLMGFGFWLGKGVK